MQMGQTISESYFEEKIVDEILAILRQRQGSVDYD